MKPFKIAAEIGQNHNGSLTEALNLLEEAVYNKVDAVKINRRNIKAFPEHWKTTPYDSPNSFGDTYYNHRVALELNDDEVSTLRKVAKSKNVLFGASFSDIVSLNYCLDLKVDYLKIASQVNEKRDLIKALPKDIPIQFSTGMMDTSTVHEMLTLLKDHEVILYQCTSSYPTPADKLNISVLNAYRDMNVSELGLSCHYPFTTKPAMLARALGASWFEYHITRDTSQKGSDHKASMTPSMFQTLRDDLESTDIMLGSPVKERLDCELPNYTKLKNI